MAYPDIFPPISNQQHLYACEKATQVGPLDIEPDAVEYLSPLQEEFTAIVKEAATAAGAHFVDPNTQGPSAFSGHDVCAGKQSWFNKPNPVHIAYSYHPTKAGQKALAADVQAAIQADSLPSGGSDQPYPMPRPANEEPQSGGLDAVSCPTTTFCMAVGAFRPIGAAPNSAVPLAERWDGHAWRLEAVPDPAATITGGFDRLQAVSCVSPTSCVAVGQGFSEIWDGTTWSIAPFDESLGPESSLNNTLTVSCVSATWCEMAGSYYNTQTLAHPLTENWNGSTWSAQTVPDPTPPTPRVNGAELETISCTSQSWCAAGGAFWEPALNEYRTLFETWDGHIWAVHPSPNVPLQWPYENGLGMISCGAQEACIGQGTALQARLTGSVWTQEAQINDGSLACVASTFCAAAGAGGGSPTVEAWHGSGWSAQTLSQPVSEVSCASSTFCMAIGASYASDAYRPT